jgi:hypothetical protein
MVRGWWACSQWPVSNPVFFDESIVHRIWSSFSHISAAAIRQFFRPLILADACRGNRWPQLPKFDAKVAPFFPTSSAELRLVFDVLRAAKTHLFFIALTTGRRRCRTNLVGRTTFFDRDSFEERRSARFNLSAHFFQGSNFFFNVGLRDVSLRATRPDDLVFRAAKYSRRTRFHGRFVRRYQGTTVSVGDRQIARKLLCVLNDARS